MENLLKTHKCLNENDSKNDEDMKILKSKIKHSLLIYESLNSGKNGYSKKKADIEEFENILEECENVNKEILEFTKNWEKSNENSKKILLQTKNCLAKYQHEHLTTFHNGFVSETSTDKMGIESENSFVDAGNSLENNKGIIEAFNKEDFKEEDSNKEEDSDKNIDLSRDSFDYKEVSIPKLPNVDLL